ncbi:hypothetical protein SA21331_1571 [Staphylococcus aureus subsp. aureus 21331]|nr:hypothetical protein SA21331_1571 [Staphylococcus aureus subsp. aureus 21331]
MIHINTTIKTKIIVVNLKTHRIDNNMLKAILKNTRNDTITVEIIEENKFLKKKTRNPAVQKKWLYIIIAILLIIVAIFVTRALLNNDSDKVSNDPKVSQNYKKQVENQDGQINQQVDNAKENIKNNQKTDDIIKNLQNQIDNLKQQEQNKADSKLTQFYQDQINKLTEANNALKNNASQGKIESMLNDINTKFDSIKSKLESLFKDDNSGGN